MKVTEVLSGAAIVEPDVFADARGFFMETYEANKFAEFGIAASFVQDNHSGSKQGTLRGLHYQIRKAQGKLVRVVAGETFNVAVDLRRSSPSFGKWFGLALSVENKLQFWLPPGFAHGFYVVTPWAEVVYKTTDFYAPEWERSILWNDPDLKIEWPLIAGNEVTISDRDRQASRFAEAETYP